MLQVTSPAFPSAPAWVLATARLLFTLLSVADQTRGLLASAPGQLTVTLRMHLSGLPRPQTRVTPPPPVAEEHSWSSSKALAPGGNRVGFPNELLSGPVAPIVASLGLPSCPSGALFRWQLPFGLGPALWKNLRFRSAFQICTGSARAQFLTDTGLAVLVPLGWDAFVHSPYASTLPVCQALC